MFQDHKCKNIVVTMLHCIQKYLKSHKLVGSEVLRALSGQTKQTTKVCGQPMPVLC